MKEDENKEDKRGSELVEESKKSKEKDKMEVIEPSASEIIPIPPPVSFPHRLKPSKVDKEFEKFVNNFKQLHINIPFIDAILQIPSYAKFLKKIMIKKKKLEDSETIALTKECSTIIQNKLPPKLKDPGRFTVPCTIDNVEFSKVLCKLGASVSLIPLTVARQLGLNELKCTNISLQLADRSIRYLLDIIIDVKCGKFKFQIGEKKVEFDWSKLKKYLFFTDHVYSVDINEELIQKMSQVNLDYDPLEFCLNDVGLQEEEIKKMINYLQAQVPYKRGNTYESLEISKRFPPSSYEQTLKLEFNQLLNHLKYAFFGEKETMPVIVNATLDEEQFDKFL
ncbi:uncharacterized protein LOC113780477 [Coffea eugenioides]|uniref:uncharacterized protein LOC113780477 n=1 Tax=Coffea eugenioides TaxID=49369 RepID=UPI000F60740A|nr:uncharacterized protein LOC113780477 [Coffea eugenioides]